MFNALRECVCVCVLGDGGVGVGGVWVWGVCGREDIFWQMKWLRIGGE